MIHTIRILFIIFVIISVLVLWKLRAYTKVISRDISRNLSERQLLLHRIGTGIGSIEAMRQVLENDDGSPAQEYQKESVNEIQEKL